jgi:hypothetical protein
MLLLLPFGILGAVILMVAFALTVKMVGIVLRVMWYASLVVGFLLLCLFCPVWMSILVPAYIVYKLRRVF